MNHVIDRRLGLTLHVSGGVFVVAGAYVYVEECFTECRGTG
jgi:hypothetical protein